MFSTFELSRFAGRPIRLFVFRRQGIVWRYASCDRNIEIETGTYAGTYLAAQIERDEIKQTIERAKDKLKIRVAYLRDPSVPEDQRPSTQALGDNWHPYIPSDSIRVTCLATHYGDDSAPAVEWMGVVVQPAYTDIELELTCEPGVLIAEAQNQGPKFQRACWKTVYSTGLRGCNLNVDALAVPGTLTAVSGDSVTAVAFAAPPRSFVGGTLQWLDDLDVEHTAQIVAHSGTTLTLDDAGDLAIGDVVTAYTIALSVAGALTAVDGLALQADEFATAPLSLAGGDIVWTRSNGLVERRAIMSHSGNTITILYGGTDLDVDTEVIARPGCPQSWAACAARGNTINYGGAIYKPVKNPSGDSMSWG